MDAQPLKQAYTVAEFVRRYSFSVGYLYLLWKRGEGPRYMKVGRRRRITLEADADWQRTMERKRFIADA